LSFFELSPHLSGSIPKTDIFTWSGSELPAGTKIVGSYST